MEKYTLISGLIMNFFFGFNDTQLVRKLVHVVSRFQPSPPGLVAAKMLHQQAHKLFKQYLILNSPSLENPWISAVILHYEQSLHY